MTALLLSIAIKNTLLSPLSHLSMFHDIWHSCLYLFHTWFRSLYPKVTRGFVVRRNAIRVALIAFTEAMALRSIQDFCSHQQGSKLSPSYVPSQFQLRYTCNWCTTSRSQLNLRQPLTCHAHFTLATNLCSK